MKALRAFAPAEEGHSGPCDPPDSPAAPKRRWTDLAPRIASAIIMVTLALVTLVKDGDAFAGFWLAASLAIHWEWQRMIDGERRMLRFFVGAIALAGATYVTLTFAASRNPEVFALSATPLGVLLLWNWTSGDLAVLAFFAGVLVLGGTASPGKRLWSAVGLVYAAALVVSVCLLRFSIFDGFNAVLWLFAVVWGTDVMAYFGGRVIGGRKLAPRISPSKTWAGSIAGLIFGAVFGVGVLAFTGALAAGAILPILLLGLVVSAVSQGGDLFESIVKRHFGFKDTSRLIPGHGGVMDRLDGFIAASTFAALFGLIRAGTAAAAAHGLLYW